MKQSDDQLEMRGSEKIKSTIKNHDIDQEDTCIVGSVSLSVRGLRDHRDIDLCVSERALKSTRNLDLPSGVSVCRGRYEDLGMSDNEIIYNDQNHDLVNGLKIVRPEITLAYKRYRNRPKDIQDIQLLEDYSKESDDWDWSIYPRQKTKTSISLVSRGFDSLQNDGVAVTAIKAWGFLERKNPKLTQIRNQLPVREIEGLYRGIRNKRTRTNPAKLLANQYTGNEFGAMDLVICWDLIETGDETIRTREFDVQSLLGERTPKKLETSQHKDTNELSVEVNYAHRIVNPAETAYLLSSGCDHVAVKHTTQRKIPQTASWLETKDVEPDTISYLDARRRDLLEQYGVCFYAILWPPSRDYHDDIEVALDAEPGINVLGSTELSISDFDIFVHDIYEAQEDDTSPDKIDEKAQKMKAFGTDVRVLTIELPKPRIRDGISLNMEMLKNDIRHEFFPRLSGDLYYSILHVTDNYRDNERTRVVLEKEGYSRSM